MYHVPAKMKDYAYVKPDGRTKKSPVFAFSAPSINPSFSPLV